MSEQQWPKVNSERVRVLDVFEKNAVHSGEIVGDVYSDGEVWADPVSLLTWRAGRPTVGEQV